MSWFEVVDPRFKGFVLGNAPPKQLATGFDWVEGPVWFEDHRCLLFSDIPNDRIMRWSEDAIGTASVSTFRKPSNFANGHTRDRQGRLVSCEHGTRRVTRTEIDGSVTVIADSHDGKKLNSPNDVAVKSDGTIWFTDPHYGIATDYEGFRSEQENPCQVYRFDPSTGALTVAADDFGCPNGLAFSPDEKTLYVAESGRAFDPTADKHIRAYDVAEDGRLSNPRRFHKVEPGHADGFRCDTDGNLWTSAADGVHCLSPEGELLGKILLPELVSNLCFGGRGKHRMFVTATTSVYSVALNRSGCVTP